MSAALACLPYATLTLWALLLGAASLGACIGFVAAGLCMAGRDNGP